MSRRLLNLPLPWGHQPHTPPDDPFSELVAEALKRRDCLAGFRRKPPRPCLLGQRAECAWGVQDHDAYFCMWKWIELHPDGPDTQPLMAKALEQSRERINSVCEEAIRKARGAAAALSLPALF